MSRLDNVILILRLMSASCALEEEAKAQTEIRTSWTGDPHPKEFHAPPYYSRITMLEPPPLDWDATQTKFGTEHYIPNYWKSRQNRKGESPNLSTVGQENEVIPAFGEFSLDVEAIAYPSDLNPAPQRDALQTWQRLFELHEAGGFAPAYEFPEGHAAPRHCGACDKWDKLPNSVNSRRPPGPTSRDVCNGCMVSYLDATEESQGAARDDLYTAWVAAKETIQKLQAEKRDAQEPAEKKAWDRKRKRAVEALKAAANACKDAGLSVGVRRRVFTDRVGDEANMSLEAPVVTATVRTVESGRR